MNKATLYGILSLAFWAAAALIIVNTGAVPTFLMGFLIFGIGFITTFCAEYARNRDIAHIFKLKPAIYIFGTTGVGVYTLLLYASFKLAPAFAANALNYLWPILLVCFLAASQRRSLTRDEITGLLLGFAGTVLLFTQKSDASVFSGSGLEFLGCLFALTAAFVWAGYSTLAKKITYPSAATSLFFMFTALLSGIGHLLFEETIWPTGAEWFLIFILGVGRASYTLWDYAMKNGDQELLSSLSYLVPLGSMALLVLFGYIPGNLLILAAGFLIVGGCLIINRQKISGLLWRKRTASDIH